MDEPGANDALAALRAVLDAPDRRSWRRLLRWPPPAHRQPLVDRLTGTTPATDDGATTTRGDEKEHLHRRRRGRFATVAVAVVLGGGGLMVSARPVARGNDAVAIGGRPPPTPEIVDRDATTTSAATRIWPAEPITVDGREVRTAGRRWEVGAEGDSVTIGDWDCDRRLTPAVLRPATGQVAVFDDWADPGVERPARTVAVVAHAVSVEAKGCGLLSVRTADGGARQFDTRPGGE